MLPLRMPDPHLQSARVLLRPPRDEDVPWLAAASRDPLIPRYTRVPVDNTEADVRAFLLASSTLADRGGEVHLLALELAGDARIGMIGLHHVEAENRSAHVGYWTAAAARGKGLTTESLRLLAGWALGPAGLERLELRADVENSASQRVAERAGFKQEGTLRGVERRRDGRHSQVVYGLLAADLLT